MLDKMLSFIAPHHCCNCGKVGSLLCDSCRYNIVSEPETVCLTCGGPAGERGICRSCRVPYDRAWHVGKRADALQRLIGLYKFERVRDGYRVLGDLLIATLPQLPPETVVVPVPTVTSHIRQRGYDHTLLIARYVAKRRELRLGRSLERVTSTTQRHATAKERETQAKQAFSAVGEITPDVPYLLVDDVITTGATLKYAAKTLKDAGAMQVWVAIIARQTLD